MMKLTELKDLTGINKVPSHPNKSTYNEWLDLYERYSQIPGTFFPVKSKEVLVSEIRKHLTEQNLNNEAYYIFKMFLRDLDEVIITRRSVKNKRKNSVLSRIAKIRWRRNRHKYQRALSKFHRSSKGKDFHKSLGRFLRKSIKKQENAEEGYVVDNREVTDLMLTINSALTHILIEYDIKFKEQPDPDLDVYDYYFLEDMILLTNQMLLELNLALKEDPTSRWEIIHDVVFLAGEVLIPSGVETEFDYVEP